MAVCGGRTYFQTQRRFNECLRSFCCGNSAVLARGDVASVPLPGFVMPGVCRRTRGSTTTSSAGVAASLGFRVVSHTCVRYVANFHEDLDPAPVFRSRYVSWLPFAAAVPKVNRRARRKLSKSPVSA
jgi:hypothetical protein